MHFRQLIRNLVLVLAVALPNDSPAGFKEICKFVLGHLASEKEDPHEILRVSSTLGDDQRGITTYISFLGALFAKNLERIRTHGGHWIDSGAGQGFALIDFLHGTTSAVEGVRLTGIGLTRPRRRDFPDKIKFISGSVEELRTDGIRKANLITDIIGPLSYSAHPEQVIRRYLELMSDDGITYIVMKKNCTYIKHRGLFSRNIDLTQWLKKIPGLNVEVEDVPDTYNIVRVKIKKVPGSTPILPNLTLRSADKGLPPGRHFWIED